MRRLRQAKIVATLGPSSATPEMIRALFDAGADVFRFNFSHGSHADHHARYQIVRQVEREVGRPIGVLADLQGPKLRIGQFAGGRAVLQTGQVFTLDRDASPGDQHRVCLPHPELFEAIHAGQSLLIDDGKLRLQVEASDGHAIRTRVVNGGVVSDRKGVNVPDAVLPIPALTAKDRRDLDFALEMGADWIALSFVQRPEDVLEARALVAGRAAILSKLEKPAALERLDEIVAVSDAIMVARGDLGVELRDVTGILGASATVTYTSSGHTSLRAARERPAAPILSITPQLATARRLALVWGVHSTISEAVHDERQMVSAACQAAVREGFARQGDQIAITAGMPFGQPGSTNLLRVAEVWG